MSAKAPPRDGDARRALSNRTDSMALEDMRRRVFVGLKSLGNLRPYMELLRNLFEHYGPLDAICTFNGFAFVQFVNEEDAHKSIHALCGQTFYQCKMDVRMVFLRGKDGEVSESPLHDSHRDRSPLRRPDKTAGLDGSGYKNKASLPVPPQLLLQPNPSPLLPPPPPQDGGNGGAVADPSGHHERLRDELYAHYYTMLQKRERDARIVDCIVIASNRSIVDYAESVGHKVRNRGLYVDLMFLASEASLPSALEEATRSGSAYAVVVSILHQLHRSCTLNILEDAPEEHRNMPLLDALRLLERHFDATRGRERARRAAALPLRAADMAGEAMRGEVGGPARAGGAGGGANPSHVQPLLELLADGRQMAPVELEAVLDYVRDRRDAALMREAAADGGGGGALGYSPAEEPPPSAPAAVTQRHQRQRSSFSGYSSEPYRSGSPPGSAAAAATSSTLLRYSLDGPGASGNGGGGGRRQGGAAQGGHGGYGGHGGGSGVDFGKQSMHR